MLEHTCPMPETQTETRPRQNARPEPWHLNLSNLWLSWQPLTLREAGATPLDDRCSGDTCHLLFCFEGCARLLGFKHGACGSLQVDAGCCGFVYHPRGCGCMVCAEKTCARGAEIQFSRRTLMRLIGPGNLRKTLARAKGATRPFEAALKITPAMDHILREVEDRLTGRREDYLFLMTKALELILIFERHFQQPRKKGVNRRDLRAVLAAQSILEDRMATPPPLEELAGQVGMSLSKLKQVFPRVCGWPPYAYLRQARMERALYLIRSTEMSVIEVAYEVGYASPSQFARAFSAQFGFTPSQARRLV